MSEQTEHLIVVLIEELEAHGLLIAAAQEMNASVKNGAVGGVQSACRKYDELTCAIASLEEKRLHYSDTICNTKGVRHVNLLTVIAHVAEPYKKRIFDLRIQIKKAIDDLSKINFSNEILLKESLLTFHKTYEMLALYNENKLAGYKKHGKKAKPLQGTSFVNKIA